MKKKSLHYMSVYLFYSYCMGSAVFAEETGNTWSLQSQQTGSDWFSCRTGQCIEETSFRKVNMRTSVGLPRIL